jgi:ATP-binding cassette, subfamily B, multidrug efflux pump
MSNKPIASVSLAKDPTTQFTDRYLLRMLGRYLLPHWRRLAVVGALLLGVTALSLTPPYLIQQAVDGPIARGDLNAILPYGLLYFATIFGVFGLRLTYTYLLQTVGQTALAAIRLALFRHITRQDMRFFNTTPVGLIVARLSNDIEALTELLSTSIVIVFSNLITLVGIIIVMFLLNWRLALVSLAVIPFMIGFTIYWRGKLRAHSSAYHKIVGEYQAYLNEHIGGMLIVQLFGRQAWSRGGFQAINQRVRDTHAAWRNAYTAYGAILQILTAIGIALVIYGGGNGVLAGWVSLGMLISFVQYTQRSFEPILQLSEQFTQIQTALAAGERIARMLEIQPSIQPPSQPQPLALTGRLQMRAVHFHYNEDAPVLRGLNLDIPAGQRVAVVGATGAGKTSLAGLLARFYDVTAGQVLIDGVDVRELSFADLHRAVAVVPQMPYCFEGTIADNLRLFTPEISDAAMQQAAEISCAARFIGRLPGGYQYKLLPGGANLSQGQKQLLALARALLHSPNGILVLDEATSSIDTETELLIQEGLQAVLKDRTSLTVAHRLSTIRDADRILVMDAGRLVEDGNHDQLLAQGGLYYRLHQRQFTESGATQTLAAD